MVFNTSLYATFTFGTLEKVVDTDTKAKLIVIGYQKRGIAAGGHFRRQGPSPTNQKWYHCNLKTKIDIWTRYESGI